VHVAECGFNAVTGLSSITSVLKLLGQEAYADNGRKKLDGSVEENLFHKMAVCTYKGVSSI
jgi:hypothetical protein